MDVHIFSDELLETSWSTRAGEWDEVQKGPFVRLLKHKDSMERKKAEFIREKESKGFFDRSNLLKNYAIVTESRFLQSPGYWWNKQEDFGCCLWK